MNAAETLLSRFASQPEAIALIDTYRGKTRETSFSELDKRGQQLAAVFRDHGLAPGDSMLVFCPMSLELYTILFALFRLGVVAIFLDPSAGRKHIEACCSLYPPRGFVAQPKAHLLRFVSRAIRDIPLKFSTERSLPGAPSIQRAAHATPCTELYPAESESPALLTFTSGTSDEPKAAMRTHGVLNAQYEAFQHTLRMRPHDVDLTILPIVVLANLVSGVTTLIPDVDLRRPSEIDPQTVLAQIETHRPRTATVSPAFIERIVDYALETHQHIPSVQKIFCGGAPVFSRLLDKLRALAPDVEVISIYGATEAEPIAAISSVDVDEKTLKAMSDGKGLLAGFPVEFIQLRIVRDSWGTPLGPFTEREFESLCLPKGAVGEIVVTGEHVLKSYLNEKHNQETKFDVDGTRWHRTGDSGYLDEAGMLWLTGRCEAVIRDERGTLNPFAVENAAQLCEGVKRAALIGGSGQRIVVLEPISATAQPDASEVKHTLAWADLDRVEVCRRIPVDSRHNAKVAYAKLRAQYGLSEEDTK